MHAENFLIDKSSNWEAIEAIGKNLPKLDTMSTLALIIESIDAIDGGAFVVTSEKEKILRVLNFVG